VVIRYYEKRKLKLNLVKKNCDIAEKIIKKYKKFWLQNYIKFRNPVTIEKILKKLNIKNHIEKRLEAEKIGVHIFGTITSAICIKY